MSLKKDHLKQKHRKTHTEKEKKVSQTKYPLKTIKISQSLEF